MKFAVGCLIVSLGTSAFAAEAPATLPSKPEEVLARKLAADTRIAASVIVNQSDVPADTQPVFVAKLTNTTKEPVSLYQANSYWNWTIEFTNLDPKSPQPGPWVLKPKSIPLRTPVDHRRVEPEASTEVKVDLNDPPFTFHYVYEGIMKELIPPARFLPPGKYRMVATIQCSPFPIKDTPGFWIGPAVTEPVAFNIAETPTPKPTEKEIAAYDAAIARVTDKLDEHGLWTNGVYQPVERAKNARIEDVIDDAINQAVTDSKDYRILHIKPFSKMNGEGGSVALLRLGKTYKVMIVSPERPGGWWNRMYDAELAPPVTEPTDSKAG